jgi:hypothetical protein
MSFSGKVKEELAAHVSRARHCQIAELAAMFQCCGQIQSEGEKNFSAKFVTENLTVAKKYSILVKKAFHVNVEMSVRGHQYFLYILKPEDTLKFIEALKLTDGNTLVHELIVQRNCCRRAFLRGLFLVCGSVTDPERGYHMEMALSKKGKAQEVVYLLKHFGIEAKVVERKRNYIVYLKEGERIVELLNVMEAHVALMEFENVRILKEMRNSINRKVNCETANIKKTVSAATRQIEDIQYIKDTSGFGKLPEGLAEIARLRLEHPEVSLKELGEMVNPPIGKSGVNHRLRKLSEVAQDLRRRNPDAKKP